MQKRFLFVSSLALGAALFLNGAVAPMAIAKDSDDAALSPTSGWSVARINGNQNTTDRYCALSREYDQGMVLTLGRNQAEEYSLAFDFQKTKLNPGKAYSLTLQPGPGQIRAYEMMPASQQAMVVRLGFDDSFMKALEKSESLKAEIDGASYNFKVSDFASGRADLDGCLAGLKGDKPTQLAKSFKAEKVENAEPIKEVEKAVEKTASKVVKAVPPPVKMETEKAEIKTAQSVVADEAPQVATSVAPTVSKIEVPKQSSFKTKPVPAPKKMAAEVAKMEPVQQEIDVKKALPSPPVEKSVPEEMAVAKKVSPSERSIRISRVDSRQSVMERPSAPSRIIEQPEPQKTLEKTEEKTEEKTVQPQQVVKALPKPTIRSNNDSLLERAGIVSRAKDTKVAKVQDKPVAPMIEQTRLQKKQRDAFQQLKAENERLNEALKTQPASVDNSAEVSAMNAQIKKLQSELAQAKANKEKLDPVDEALKFDLEKLRSENEQLKLAARAQSKKQEMTVEPVVSKAEEKKQDPEVLKQLENLKSENTRLSAALQGQEKKAAAFDAKSPAAEKELENMRRELTDLRNENRKLYEEARKIRGEADTAFVKTGNQALKKIREYEKKLEAAQNDNLALAKEIEELRRVKEDVRLESVAGNWDLEKATKRYNEAEREIKRLGMLLEQQRMAHRQEKTELEGMLFDPAVTDREQRKRLTELELQLAEAERQLKVSGRSASTHPSRAITPRPPMEERVDVSVAMPAPEVERQRDNLEVQRLKNQLARKNQQLQAYSRQQEVVVAPTVPPVSSSPIVSKPIASKPIVSSVPSVATAFDQKQIQQLLRNAGVTTRGGVMKKATGVYSWNAGNLFGQAQIVPVQRAGSVDNFAQDYIAKAKQACQGDFASLPSTMGGSAKAYEIACIGPSRSVSSSLLVTQKGNDLIAIAHESSADDMDAAMDVRDKIAASL